MVDLTRSDGHVLYMVQVDLDPTPSLAELGEEEVAFSSIGVSAPGHSSPALVGSRVYGHYRGPFFVRLILKYFLLGHLVREGLHSSEYEGPLGPETRIGGAA